MSRAHACARPGCSGPADAWFTYDYRTRRVWLDDAQDLEAGDQWGLCEAHAGRMRPPYGWALVDRRVRQRPRFEPPSSLVS